MVLGGSCLLLVVFGIPETYAPTLLAQRAKRRRVEENRPELHSDERVDSSIKQLMHRTLLRPFKMFSTEVSHFQVNIYTLETGANEFPCLTLPLQPILVLVSMYLSIVYGLLYGLFEVSLFSLPPRPFDFHLEIFPCTFLLEQRFRHSPLSGAISEVLTRLSLAYCLLVLGSGLR